MWKYKRLIGMLLVFSGCLGFYCLLFMRYEISFKSITTNFFLWFLIIALTIYISYDNNSSVLELIRLKSYDAYYLYKLKDSIIRNILIVSWIIFNYVLVSLFLKIELSLDVCLVSLFRYFLILEFLSIMIILTGFFKHSNGWMIIVGCVFMIMIFTARNGALSPINLFTVLISDNRRYYLNYLIDACLISLLIMYQRKKGEVC